jgi:hypothetical protein
MYKIIIDELYLFLKDLFIETGNKYGIMLLE